MKMLGFTFCIFVLSSLLFLCSSVPQTCTGREIFTNKSGTIRGGVKNETIRVGEENKYSNYSRCEWLIDGKYNIINKYTQWQCIHLYVFCK